MHRYALGSLSSHALVTERHESLLQARPPPAPTSRGGFRLHHLTTILREGKTNAACACPRGAPILVLEVRVKFTVSADEVHAGHAGMSVMRRHASELLRFVLLVAVVSATFTTAEVSSRTRWHHILWWLHPQVYRATPPHPPPPPTNPPPPSPASRRAGEQVPNRHSRARAAQARPLRQLLSFSSGRSLLGGLLNSLVSTGGNDLAVYSAAAPAASDAGRGVVDVLHGMLGTPATAAVTPSGARSLLCQPARASLPLQSGVFSSHNRVCWLARGRLLTPTDLHLLAEPSPASASQACSSGQRSQRQRPRQRRRWCSMRSWTARPPPWRRCRRRRRPCRRCRWRKPA